MHLLRGLQMIKWIRRLWCKHDGDIYALDDYNNQLDMGVEIEIQCSKCGKKTMINMYELLFGDPAEKLRE